MTTVTLERALWSVLEEDTPVRLSRGLGLRWTDSREDPRRGTLSLSRLSVYPSDQEIQIVRNTLSEHFGVHEVTGVERAEEGKQKIIRLAITWQGAKHE